MSEECRATTNKQIYDTQQTEEDGVGEAQEWPNILHQYLSGKSGGRGGIREREGRRDREGVDIQYYTLPLSPPPTHSCHSLLPTVHYNYIPLTVLLMIIMMMFLL